MSNVAAPSKDGDLAVTEVGLVVVATPRPYLQDQPDLEGSLHQPDQVDSRAGASVVASVGLVVVASEAASVATEEVSVATEAVLVATEEVSVDEEASAIKVEVALEDDPMALVGALHRLPMRHPVQVVVVVAAWDLVGMVEVRTVAHP